MVMNRKEFARLYKGLGPDKCLSHITECLEDKTLRPDDFSLKDVAEGILGNEFVQLCDPSMQGTAVTRVLESDGVDSTAFSNITGQIVFAKVLEAYETAPRVARSLADTVQTRQKSGEKLPGITRKGDTAKEVHEGMPYPRAGFGEEYVETPPLKKYGEIVPITKEAIFFDLTGQVLMRAAEVGEWLGVTQEKLLMDAIIGVASTFATGGKWKWKGTEYAVYNTNTVDFASYFYLNSLTNALTDWTDLDEADQLFAEMRDPITREPLNLNPNLTLLHVPALGSTVSRVRNATEIRVGTGSATVPTTIGGNPIRAFTPVESKYAYRRLIDAGSIAAADAKKYWWYGDFKKAFAWMEAWPITPSKSPPNSQAEFERDIIAQYKASMMGCAAVLKPQYVIKSTGAS